MRVGEDLGLLDVELVRVFDTISCSPVDHVAQLMLAIARQDQALSEVAALLLCRIDTSLASLKYAVLYSSNRRLAKNAVLCENSMQMGHL